MLINWSSHRSASGSIERNDILSVLLVKLIFLVGQSTLPEDADFLTLFIFLGKLVSFGSGFE